jgi:tRNA pseudouridine32 synthase/23S rRNA pseudouridine746 synthase
LTKLTFTTLNHHFTSFLTEIDGIELPNKFTYPFDYNPHALAILACNEVKDYLETQTEIDHNFGLRVGQSGQIIGKMFGVLVVQKPTGEVGYLTAFSGKVAGGNHHAHFIPPVFDGLTEGSFVNLGMTELTNINNQLAELKKDDSKAGKQAVNNLINHRTKHCNEILDRIVDSYHFLNIDKESKALGTIFEEKFNKKPPGGAGECALPKLLQFAFSHDLKPLAMAEFWWGKSPKGKVMHHGAYYPACLDKCEPILEHMLKGMEVDHNYPKL